MSLDLLSTKRFVLGRYRHYLRDLSAVRQHLGNVRYLGPAGIVDRVKDDLDAALNSLQAATTKAEQIAAELEREIRAADPPLPKFDVDDPVHVLPKDLRDGAWVVVNRSDYEPGWNPAPGYYYDVRWARDPRAVILGLHESKLWKAKED